MAKLTDFVCQWCDNPFRAVSNGRNKYCSALCKGRANSNSGRHALTCAGCGGLFGSDRKDRAYCSWQCKIDAQATGRTQRSCEWCGKQFVPTHYHTDASSKKPQRACSGFCSRALRATKRFSDVWPCVCGKRMLHRRPRKRCQECPPIYTYEKRAGLPVLRMCSAGCGISIWMPARQGSWMCNVCKRLNRRASKYKGVNDFLRAEVLARDSWTCQLCGFPIPQGLTNPCDDLYPNIDHVVPRALGGLTQMDNLQASHRICNINKGANLGTTEDAA